MEIQMTTSRKIVKRTSNTKAAEVNKLSTWTWVKIAVLSMVGAAIIITNPGDFFGIKAKEQAVILKAELAANQLAVQELRKVSMQQEEALERARQVAIAKEAAYKRSLAKKEEAVRLYALATAQYKEALAQARYYEALQEVARVDELYKSSWEKAKDAFSRGYQEAYTGTQETKKALASKIDTNVAQAKLTLEKARIQMEERRIQLAEATSNALK
jgi:flagellar biosynthesis/type III secretory pathway protein FliH